MLWVKVGVFDMAKRKRPQNMTTEQAIRKLFPKRVVETVKQEASGKSRPSKSSIEPHSSKE